MYQLIENKLHFNENEKEDKRYFKAPVRQYNYKALESFLNEQEMAGFELTLINGDGHLNFTRKSKLYDTSAGEVYNQYSVESIDAGFHYSSLNKKKAFVDDYISKMKECGYDYMGNSKRIMIFKKNEYLDIDKEDFGEPTTNNPKDILKKMTFNINKYLYGSLSTLLLTFYITFYKHFNGHMFSVLSKPIFQIDSSIMYQSMLLLLYSLLLFICCISIKVKIIQQEKLGALGNLDDYHTLHKYVKLESYSPYVFISLLLLPVIIKHFMAVLFMTICIAIVFYIHFHTFRLKNIFDKNKCQEEDSNKMNLLTASLIGAIVLLAALFITVTPYIPEPYLYARSYISEEMAVDLEIIIQENQYLSGISKQEKLTSDLFCPIIYRQSITIHDDELPNKDQTLLAVKHSHTVGRDAYNLEKSTYYFINKYFADKNIDDLVSKSQNVIQSNDAIKNKRVYLFNYDLYAFFIVADGRKVEIIKTFEEDYTIDDYIMLYKKTTL